MTLVSDILLQGFQESNLVSANVSALDTARETLALSRFQGIVAQVMGWEAGENLVPWSVGSAGIDTASLPAGAELDATKWKYPPINRRLMCNLAAPETVVLQYQPSDGARIAVQDIPGNFATNPLTLDANGRLIDGNRTLILNTNSTNSVWFYREDLGEWKIISTLLATDTMPFPVEFNDFFAIMLAMRLNPSYGRKMDPLTLQMFKRSREMFMARYKQEEDLDLGTVFARNPVSGYSGFYDGNDAEFYGVT